MLAADIEAEAVADGRVPVWEKFILLAAVAGFCGASRLPIGPLWADAFTRARFMDACREVERVARAEGVPVAADVIDRIPAYVDSIPASMRASLLIDLAAGEAHRSRSAARIRCPPWRARRSADTDHGDAVRRAAASRGREQDTHTFAEVSDVPFRITRGRTVPSAPCAMRRRLRLEDVAVVHLAAVDVQRH